MAFWSNHKNIDCPNFTLCICFKIFNKSKLILKFQKILGCLFFCLSPPFFPQLASFSIVLPHFSNGYLRYPISMSLLCRTYFQIDPCKTSWSTNAVVLQLSLQGSGFFFLFPLGAAGWVETEVWLPCSKKRYFPDLLLQSAPVTLWTGHRWAD